ncbi:hypothetical protein RhiirA5_428171 [Rhizophagus irregularis]|uniref:Uncharacterized protein n=1 Tax=Rhizophagus irregularis TaxID=588596 RepID=A0A2N0P0W1_9GLOM|nr:hypothetical protein RhiirA5_428171 [Rhizophagus irregularis]CAB5094183.1 unnamed protein product [Rhizophagus irregularis]
MLQTTFDSRGIDNSNVLTLGSMVTNNDNVKEIIETWLKTNFTSRWGGRKQEVVYSQLSLLRTLRFSLQIHYKTFNWVFSQTIISTMDVSPTIISLTGSFYQQSFH